jgi:hypothetical protein
VDIAVLESPFALRLIEIAIEQGDSQEPGAVSAGEGGANLDHPVDHLRAVVICD